MNDLNGYDSPFSKPLYSLPTTDFSGILTIAFFFIFVAWLIYTIVVAYHWFRYGHQSWLAVPAIGIHLFVSGLLIFYIALGVK
jgi:hypothetical protein